MERYLNESRFAEVASSLQESGAMFAVFESLRTTTATNVAALRCALDENDMLRVAALCHALKGSCSTFGVERLSDAATHLQNLARAGVMSAELAEASSVVFALARRLPEEIEAGLEALSSG